MHPSSILPTPHGLDTARVPQHGSTLRSRLRRAGLAIWRALEASGHARAMRELRFIHGQWEISDPELARQLRSGSAFPGSQAESPRA